MSLVHSYATTLLNPYLRCFVPMMRLENPITSTWRAYRVLCRLRVKQEYGSHFTKWQKQLTSYYSYLPDEVSECSLWRNMCFSSRYKCTAVDANRFIVHKFTKSLNGPSNSCRYYSDKVAETRKTVSKKIGEIKENVLTIPNGLCLLRMVATPFLGYLVLQEWYATSLGLFIFAGCTDVKTITRYFDMSFVTARLSPTGISKINTLVQLSLVACSLAAPVFDFTDHTYLQTLWYVTAASTILSAGSYLCYKDTYKVLAARMEKGRK